MIPVEQCLRILVEDLAFGEVAILAEMPGIVIGGGIRADDEGGVLIDGEGIRSFRTGELYGPAVRVSGARFEVDIKSVHAPRVAGDKSGSLVFSNGYMCIAHRPAHYPHSVLARVAKLTNEAQGGSVAFHSWQLVVDRHDGAEVLFSVRDGSLFLYPA